MAFLKRLTSKLNVARGMTIREALWFFEAWFTLGWVHFLLSRKSYEEVKHEFQGLGDMSSCDQPEPWTFRMRSVFRMAARNHIWHMNCLRIAIALRKMLNRRGVRPALRFGVTKEEGKVKAHAWLELAGQVFSEHESVLQRYRPLETGEEN